MNIWFYLSLALLVICIFLISKIIIMKASLRDVTENMKKKLESDTNSLLTISSYDKDIKRLTKSLNLNLKRLRKLELEYKQGNTNFKNSITNISHDLRTPLTAIRGYLDIMDYSNLTKRQIEYIHVIDQKTNDLIYLTEELFLYANGCKDAEKINKEEICLNTELESIICSFYSLFKQKKIEPKINFCKRKIIKKLDLNCFKRIIENIITNAIKYSEGNLKINLSENGEIIFINPTTKLDKISVKKLFNRYYTVENGKKSTGIGLSIAKSLAELNDGLIEAKYIKNNLIIKIKF